MPPDAQTEHNDMQWQFLDALGDGIYGVDPAGCCVFINVAALDMLGFAGRDEVLGRNMHALIHHTRPDGSAFPQAECPLLHTTRSGRPVRLDNEMLWRRDGTPFFAEYSSFPISAGGVITGSIITFSDTSVRQGAQRRLAVQYAVAQVLAGLGAEADMPLLLLESIGTGLDWDGGLFWRRIADGVGHDVLSCTAVWGRTQESVFDRANLGRVLELGAGLPGEVWVMEEAIHLPDLAAQTLSPRAAEAARAGLRSALAFPLMDGRALVGAIEFYSRQPIAMDESLLEAVSTLGHQIGRSLEKRHVADALSESERLKAAILAAAPDGVITTDRHGRILEFNAAAESIFGRAAADVIGQELAATIFPAETQAGHRDALARLTGGDGSAIGRRVEVEAVRADGRHFPIELSTTRTATGARPLFTMHLRDITGRRREQARVRESEARFRTIANAIPQLSWMTDASGAIVWYNQRWYDYTGTSFEDMQGWGWRSVHHPDHLERVERRLRLSFAAGEEWEDTFPLRAADGSHNWFLSRALPMRDEPDAENPQGRLVGWFGTNTDVTAMREAEHTLARARDEAEAANRAKSTFIANMSHELRTPLSAIIGYTEMVAEEIEDGASPAGLLTDLGKIEGNARHLLGLINDVLDLSKVESGKMEAYIETFDIAQMARDVAATVGSLMEKKQNRLELQLAPALGTMQSDATRIRQMLLNLLSNAAKFTEGGTITLQIERTASANGVAQVAFAITDTGIGMTEEQLGRLFQRFQQADASTTRQFGGTGLGLALTRAFADLLGGEVSVTSVAGQGSTFTLRMPATHAAPAAEDAAAETPPEGGDIVLVVDDDEPQRDLMSRFLIREGYVPRTAPDGQTALALARSLRPRAILLDVAMPGMDGWSVLTALKADNGLAAIPVVMVTFVSERALATSLGAADYIVKPVDWARLREVMERFRAAQGDILVVDDDADARARMRHTLERNGWTVVEAENGQQALDRVAHARPRVILLDLNMPVMDGFDCLAALRECPGCADIPVVVLTALELTAEDRRRLRGASQVLSKGEMGLQELGEVLRRQMQGDLF